MSLLRRRNLAALHERACHNALGFQLADRYIPLDIQACSFPPADLLESHSEWMEV